MIFQRLRAILTHTPNAVDSVACVPARRSVDDRSCRFVCARSPAPPSIDVDDLRFCVHVGTLSRLCRAPACRSEDSPCKLKGEATPQWSLPTSTRIPPVTSPWPNLLMLRDATNSSASTSNRDCSRRCAGTAMRPRPNQRRDRIRKAVVVEVDQRGTEWWDPADPLSS